VLSLRKLRQGILRDLAWLLNTTHLETTQDLEDYPQVAQSVLNYGVADFGGQAVAGLDLASIARVLKQAILDFEPRILRQSVKVRVMPPADPLGHNALAFEIEGQLWAQPTPTRLFLKTEVDLEDGTFSVSEAGQS
jgi:type VI secretion system protein ImpF